MKYLWLIQSIILHLVGNLIERLATKNIDVSKKDSAGNTAFHIAAKSGNFAGINAIIETIKEKKMKLISAKNKEVSMLNCYLIWYK